MKKNIYRIKFEWIIRDTRNISGGYRYGTSTLEVYASNKVEAINRAIEFCENLPSWEFGRNNINIEDYRDGKYCRYCYLTQINRILEVEKIDYKALQDKLKRC